MAGKTKNQDKQSGADKADETAPFGRGAVAAMSQGERR